MNSSPATKVQVIGDVADQVIQKYTQDPFEFVRVIFGWILRPFQWEWWFLMDEYSDVLGVCCQRVGKTVVVSLKNLYEQLTNPWENLGIYAPKYDQAVDTFKPQYEIIERQKVVRAMLKKSTAGKADYGRGFANYINGSGARCFGVTADFEGVENSIQHIDEYDDIPPDEIKRVLGRATGKNRNGLPNRKRYTGVIWGQLNIWKADQDPNIFTLPKVDVYDGLAAGYLELKDVLEQRRAFTDDEWLRTQCLIYVESRNFIWSNWLHASQMIGLYWRLHPIPPIPGGIFYKRGIVGFGWDMGKQGSGEDSSDFALEVTEQVGPFRRWLWGCTWSPDTDPETLIRDLADYWTFFQPDIGFSDAADANLAAQLNDELYRRGLVYYNWRMAGQNDIEGWKKWAKKGLMTPLHNSGRTKHHIYGSLRNAINNCVRIGKDNKPPSGNVFIFPPIDREKAVKLESWRELQITIRELENLVATRTETGYYKIERYRKKIEDAKLNFSGSTRLGDDRPDALAMSNFGLDFMQSRKLVGGNISVDYI